MYRRIITATALALPLMACDGTTPREITELTPELQAVVDGNTAFARDVYTAAAADEGNLIFSPFSMSSALSMTYAGAAGTTAEEMRDVLHIGLTDAEHHSNLGALSRDLDGFDKRRDYELNIANRLFGTADLTWKQDFLDINALDYGAPFTPTDFTGDPEGARVEINAWVAEHTGDKIEELFPAGTIDSSTAMVLANAVYFKGDWKHKFDKADTAEQPFALLDGSSVQVNTMRQSNEDARFAEGEGYQVALLPYEGDELSMFLIVPDAEDGLSAVEADLETALALLDDAIEREVYVELPSFEVRWKATLNDMLAELGMPTAFGGGADFSAMTGTPLYISTVIHEAYFRVDEEGTEAAAATGVSVDRGSASEPVDVIADHPFLYGIRDDLTGSVLFIGRMSDPSVALE